MAMDKTTIEANTGYRVLARKYRPKDFSDLMVGQEPMVRTLTNAFETGRIAQAYMLTGVRGVGKTTTARILARGLNYKTATIDKPTIDLKEIGEHCQAIMEGRHVDVIEMDAASHTGIDDIREIIDQVRYRPSTARYKVYIIDEVHMLSTQAFNGLLKTLEEPPEHVKFIFATTEIRKVPITVLSRCQRFDLRRIPAADLVRLFSTISAKEGVEIEDEALSMIARAAEGSARDGLSLLDQAISHGNGKVEAAAVRGMLGLADRARIVDLFGHVVAGDVKAALAEFLSQYEAGANPVVVLNDLADFTHLVTRLKYVPEGAEDVSLSELERTRGAEFAAAIPVSALSRIWQMLLKGIPETENAARPFGAAEMVLIRLAHAASLPSPEDAARRLLAIENGDVHPAPAAPRGPSGGGAQASTHAVSRPVAEPRAETPRPPATVTMLRPREATAPEVSPEPEVAPEPEVLETQAVEAAPEPDIVPEPVVAPEPAPAEITGPTSKIKSLRDITDLCSQNRAIKLRAEIRNFVHLVRLEPGQLEVNLESGTSQTFLNELGTKLKEWTGEKWFVSLSREPGQPTLVEAERAERERLFQDARDDPSISAILKFFPGAKITDVKVRADEQNTETTEAGAPDAAVNDDGDVLPEDDLDD
ncbi:DNA polymerase III subunit gamma/tau [Martelella endophytica]|uniref:DNA polymerase III subunit gamma/tau n=1 Tax=Martelella endophytica TaxID=1486262 RepID=A0A0D5LJS5_MAREN|nr:DNA polymerase III subunit gamma/tau [Martelella endophytica]AJY44439.1 DNA polymerase III subunits gamma and tau [Martelella endophytica]